MGAKILVVDDEESIRYTFREFLSEEGYDVDTAGNYRDALLALKKTDYDVVFTDIILKGKTGIEILDAIKNKKIDCPVIIITGVPEIESATSALRLGAFDYIPKPVMQDQLLSVTKKALEKKLTLEREKSNYSHMKAVFRSVNDAIITMNKDLTILEVNDSARRICGLPETAIGNKFNIYTEHCDGKCLPSIGKTLRKKQTREMVHVECQKSSNMDQIVNITTYPLLNEKGAIIGIVMVVKDKSVAEAEKKSRSETNKFHRIISRSEKMQSVLATIKNLADVQTTVLITGESGTGKELVAEAIHYEGVRKDKPLVKVNCSALSESLLESELFGHVKGAFTGAVQDKTGRFQKANGGTIFLDEIGDLSQNLQLKLLRVLQEREFERVGDASPVKVDVRVIAATHHNLKDKIKTKEFREDLYYRLNVVEIHLPPLRNRKEDIPLLTQYFIDEFNKKMHKEIEYVSEEVNELFMNYQWPGNIRELEHAIEHAFVVCRQNVITIDHLPDNLKIKSSGISPILKSNWLETERQSIILALEKANGNKSAAAEILGMSRRTIYRKIKEHNIDIKEQTDDYSVDTDDEIT
ncbi:MAG: sigma-54-dependent Fis family transcriptional regulator [Planctomycetes bacterium]|nr:sigma-54-dependent Fis family transcriptional regulator [Planctomycetota bacterium]